jgi:hypothetical protein
VQQHDEIAEYGLPVASRNNGKNMGVTPQFHVVALLDTIRIEKGAIYFAPFCCALSTFIGLGVKVSYGG